MKTMNRLKVVAFAALCAAAVTSAQAKPLENGIGWNGIGWNGIGWNGIGWNGIGWNGIGWNGIGWNGIGWNDVVPDSSSTAMAQSLSALADQPLR